MEKEIEMTDELIAKYLTGEATPEEAIALLEWKEQTDNKKYYEDFESAWYASYPVKQPRLVNKNTAWNKVSDQLPLKRKQRSFYSTYGSILKIAASVILVLGLGAIIFYSTRETIPVIEQISKDKIERIELPDQSVVTLSRESKIAYKNEFKGNTRELTLEGEAFFKITPDKNKPFIIHTPSADIKVVGTSFNVIEKNGRLEVSVAEGKVQILSSGKSGSKGEYLEAGQTGVIETSGESIEIKNTVDMNAMGYATHQFLFKNTPMAEVLKAIEKSYPNSITISDKAIENCRLTATFENASVENILSLVAETLDLAVTKDGQTFVLQGRGCP